jgi:solute carrier family 39 (zinc transporter), member 1/2/3
MLSVKEKFAQNLKDESL